MMKSVKCGTARRACTSTRALVAYCDIGIGAAHELNVFDCPAYFKDLLRSMILSRRQGPSRDVVVAQSFHGGSS